MKNFLSNIFFKLKNDRFYFDSFILTLFSVVGNLFAFLVNIIYTRTLPEGGYGAVMSINGIINILGTMAIGFRMFSVKVTSDMVANGENAKAIHFSYKFTLFTHFVMVAILILLYPFYGILAQFINVDSTFAIILSGVIIIFNYLSSITSSLFQSMKMFFSLGIISLSYPLIRFVLTYPLIKVWNGYIGAPASMVIAATVSFISTSLITKMSSKFEEYKGKLKFNLSEFIPLIPIVLMNILYSILNYVDLLFVRRYFEEAQTDMFAIASTIAKATLFVIIPVSYVILPRMIDDYHKKGYKASINALIKGIILSLLACLAYLGIIAVFGDLILMIFGTRYLEAKPLVLPFTIAFIPMGLSFLLINYSVTFKNWLLSIPLALANVGLIGGFIIWHSSFYKMILVYGVVGTILLMLLLVFVAFSREPKGGDKNIEEVTTANYQ